MLAPTDYQAIVLSLKVAGMATLLSLPFGFFAGYVLAFHRFKGKTMLEVILNLPLALPPVVIGYMLLLLLGKHGWIGAWLHAAGVDLLFTWKAGVAASAVVGFPLLVRTIRLGMEAIDTRFVRNARMLGASQLDVIFSIILPLAGRAILAGAFLMFARSLGEFGATIIVAGNIPGVTQTLPLAIYQYAATPGGDQTALGLCVVAGLISFLALSLHEWVLRRCEKRE